MIHLRDAQYVAAREYGFHNWRLDVANFDRDHAADCTLRIEYLK